MKIAPVFLRYDYGIKSRGDSLEYKGFYPAGFRTQFIFLIPYGWIHLRIEVLWGFLSQSKHRI